MSNVIQQLCNCCTNCFRQELYGCDGIIEFDVTGTPDQDAFLYIVNHATGRIVILSGEILNDVASFDLSDVNLAVDMNYKAHIRDAAGQVVDFDENGESYDCYEFRIKPIYAN